MKRRILVLGVILLCGLVIGCGRFERPGLWKDYELQIIEHSLIGERGPEVLIKVKNSRNFPLTDIRASARWYATDDTFLGSTSGSFNSLTSNILENLEPGETAKIRVKAPRGEENRASYYKLMKVVGTYDPLGAKDWRVVYRLGETFREVGSTRSGARERGIEEYRRHKRKERERLELQILEQRLSQKKDLFGVVPVVVGRARNNRGFPLHKIKAEVRWYTTDGSFIGSSVDGLGGEHLKPGEIWGFRVAPSAIGYRLPPEKVARYRLKVRGERKRRGH